MIKLSDTSREVLNMASFVAESFGHSFIDCEHLLLVLLGESTYSKLIKNRLKTDNIIGYREIKKYVISNVGEGERIDGFCKRFSRRLVDAIRKGYILAASNKDKEIKIEYIIDVLVCEKDVKELLLVANGNKATSLKDVDYPPDNSFIYDLAYLNKISKDTPTLNLYSKDLTLEALKGNIDPIYYRDEEIKSIISILLRKNKNNPCLIGYPGVGKTAVVEGFAEMIVNGNVPEKLKKTRVVALDLSSLIAGAKYRGDFEERIKKVIQEIKSVKNVIVFIDEIHSIVKLGAGEGTLDVANILKPELARGEISVIGATTADEYVQTISRDEALDRRFRRVMIKEPGIDSAIMILKGIKPRYESFHEIEIDDEAIAYSVSKSVELFPDKYLPDKAIDLIDECATFLKIYENSRMTCFELRNYINKEYKPWDVDAEKLKFKLCEKVFGQKKAMSAIADTFKLKNYTNSSVSFLFCGGHGCGKSYTAERLCEALYGNNSLLKFNMNEFSEKQSVSKLIGAAPGYVGYDEGGFLFKEMIKNPNRVLVFESIEKAHSEILDFIESIISEGALRCKGKSVSFSKSVIIITSTFEECEIAKPGFTRETEKNIKNPLLKRFENTVDALVEFSPFEYRASLDLVGSLEKELSDKCSFYGATLHISETVKKEIIRKSDVYTKGYKNILSVFRREIEVQILEHLNKKTHPNNLLIDVDKENKFVITENFEKINLENN